jgi:hypothetical protein
MRPTTASETNIYDISTLLHPGTSFDRPLDVVTHPELSLSEKRATSHPGRPMRPPLHRVPPSALRND